MKCGRLLGAAQTLKFREAATHECEGQIVAGSKRCAWGPFICASRRSDANDGGARSSLKMCDLSPEQDIAQAILWQLASPAGNAHRSRFLANMSVIKHCPNYRLLRAKSGFTDLRLIKLELNSAGKI